MHQHHPTKLPAWNVWLDWMLFARLQNVRCVAPYAEKVLFSIHGKSSICATVCHARFVCHCWCHFSLSFFFWGGNVHAWWQILLRCLCIPHRFVHKLHIECCSIWTQLHFQRKKKERFDTYISQWWKTIDGWRTHTHSRIVCMCNDFQVWSLLVFWLWLCRLGKQCGWSICDEFFNSSIFRCIKTSLRGICIEHVILLDFGVQLFPIDGCIRKPEEYQIQHDTSINFEYIEVEKTSKQRKDMKKKKKTAFHIING